MNKVYKVYKVIWSEVSQAFVAVPEVVRGASKSSCASPHAPHQTVRRGHAHFFIKSLVAALICIGFTFAIHAAPLSAPLTAPAANQLPTGAQVSAGCAPIVPVPAPSPAVPMTSMGLRLPIRWGAEG